jgi:hypothetical protein
MSWRHLYLKFRVSFSTRWFHQVSSHSNYLDLGSQKIEDVRTVLDYAYKRNIDTFIQTRDRDIIMRGMVQHNQKKQCFCHCCYWFHTYCWSEAQNLAQRGGYQLKLQCICTWGHTKSTCFERHTYVR